MKQFQRTVDRTAEIAAEALIVELRETAVERVEHLGQKWKPERTLEGRAAAALESLRDALRPFVEAYERSGRRESWAASYLNNNAWKAAAEALPTKGSGATGSAPEFDSGRVGSSPASPSNPDSIEELA